VDVGLVDVALVDVGLVDVGLVFMDERNGAGGPDDFHQADVHQADVHQGAFRFLALDSYSRIKERNARDARDR